MISKPNDSSMETINIEVPCVSTSEIKKALKGMSRGKAMSADGLSIDLIKDASNFLLNKLAILFTKYSAPSNFAIFQFCGTVKCSFKLIILWITIYLCYSVFFFVVGCIITCICVRTRKKI